MQILFVCSGNTCRSPMAEYILKEKLKKANIKGVRVKSAGTSAEEGATISKNSKEALKLYGIAVKSFKAKRVTMELLDKSALVLCMTDSHKYQLLPYTEKAKTVAEFTGGKEISDPFGYDINVYIKTLYEIEKACDIIIEKIKGQGVNKK